jgi:hypothetical protein
MVGAFKSLDFVLSAHPYCLLFLGTQMNCLSICEGGSMIIFM